MMIKKIFSGIEETCTGRSSETPRVGLVRTIFEMIGEGVEDEFAPAMNVSTINGLSRIRQAYDGLGMKMNPDEKRFGLLKNLIENTPDGSPFSGKIKT